MSAAAAERGGIATVSRPGGFDLDDFDFDDNSEGDNGCDCDTGCATAAVCDGRPRGTAISSRPGEYTDGTSATMSSSSNSLWPRLSGSASAHSSRSVTVDDVGAPESRFHSWDRLRWCDDDCRLRVVLELLVVVVVLDLVLMLVVRKKGCSSTGGGGGTTTTGDVGALRALLLRAVGAVEAVVADDGARLMRRGSRGGGRGIGGSACLVCSYRSATSPVSSRKGVSRVVVPPAGRPRWWRMLPNR